MSSTRFAGLGLAGVIGRRHGRGWCQWTQRSCVPSSLRQRLQLRRRVCLMLSSGCWASRTWTCDSPWRPTWTSRPASRCSWAGTPIAWPSSPPPRRSPPYLRAGPCPPNSDCRLGSSITTWPRSLPGRPVRVAARPNGPGNKVWATGPSSLCCAGREAQNPPSHPPRPARGGPVACGSSPLRRTVAAHRQLWRRAQRRPRRCRRPCECSIALEPFGAVDEHMGDPITPLVGDG